MLWFSTICGRRPGLVRIVERRAGYSSDSIVGPSREVATPPGVPAKLCQG